MKYFKDESGTLYAFESDGSQDSYISPSLVPITEAEAFPAPSSEQIFQSIVSQFDTAVEAHLHNEAVAHGYTNIERACMYSSFPNQYQEESQSFVQWSGNVWAYCYGELLRVGAGERAMPTIPQILSELPTRAVHSV